MKNDIINALKLYAQAFKIPQVRNKLFITFLILVLFRFVVSIPVPGVKIEVLKSFFAQNQFLSVLDMFSGGTLSRFSLSALGLNPYINASILFQLLGFVFPQIAELRKEGEYGQQKLARYTRLATIPLGILQSFGIYGLLRSQGIVDSLGVMALASFVVTLVAGTMIMVFLGELINQFGIGKGISLLIFSGIVTQYPVSFARTLSVSSGENAFGILVFIIMAIAVIAGVVFVDEAFYKVPVRYARRAVRSNRAQESYLPLKINSAGVMPIIFALSLVSLPQLIGNLLSRVSTETLSSFGQTLISSFQVNGFLYNLSYFIFVVFFGYIYTVVVFNPKEVAENLRKSGGFIPGVRPGKSTENRLSFLLSRISVSGALFLGLIAVLPAIAQNLTNLGTISIGGTGILIVVSVALELHRLIENLVQTWHYQSY